MIYAIFKLNLIWPSHIFFGLMENQKNLALSAQYIKTNFVLGLIWTQNLLKILRVILLTNISESNERQSIPI